MPFEASLTNVVNDALALIGEGRITSLDENTTKAQICREHVPLLLRAALASARWNFSYTRAVLAADATAPAFGFAAQYSVPSDSVRVHGVGDDGNGSPDESIRFKVERGKILCNVTSGSLPIHYGYYTENPVEWSGGFTMAYSKLLSSRLAGSIAQDAQLARSLLEEFLKIDLPQAAAEDGQEGSVDVFSVPDLITVRDG